MTLNAHAAAPVTATSSIVNIQRVAHFTDTYLPRRDGVVASLHTLKDALGVDGCSGLIVAPRHPDHPERADLLTVASMPCGVANLRLGAWPMSRHVRRVAEWGPQLIHVHTPGPVGLLGVLTARRLGLPLVQTYHTDLHAYADAYRVPAKALKILYELYARRLGAPRLKAGTRHEILDAANQLLLGDANAVVVPTPAVLSRVKLPSAKIFLVPAAVPQRPAPAQAVADFRARHGLSGRVVLFVGRVNREKGIELLIPAFARVPGAQLVLIGAVYEHRWLNRLLAKHGVADRVVITGQLPPSQVAAAYAGADVFAFPSQTDTQGLVLQEAALAGVPSVLADPSLHRMGALGDATVLAAPDPSSFAAAINGLLNDPVGAQALGALARGRALAHTPARYAATMREVYSLAAARS
ncbi:glycosyltransferase [Allorhizocola rhizosphaerae]|uniref:glycosyltransferase n=1 Tax=Allorhizocola rhizosphaerae TaxID=1872709 RepID=UPI000E3B83B3|nr:glycosyltransferase [Allorhizocola rhizosphaerae]